MKNMVHSGFEIYYGKKAKRDGLYAMITDRSDSIGKTPYAYIRIETTDAESRARLLIAVGQEIRYLEMNEVDPTKPFEGKTVEWDI